MDPEQDDIAGDIRAALAEVRADAPPEQVTPPPVIETPEQDAQPERDDGRDNLGRFKAKEPEAQQTDAGDQKPQQQGAGAAGFEKPLLPPRNWEPDAKAQFMAAPPAIQKQILAQVDAAAKGEEAWKPRAQTWDQVEQALAPVKDSWSMRGISVPQGIQMLATAQKMLDDNPAQGLAQIAKSYGYNLETLLQAWGVDLNNLQAPQQYEGGSQIPPQYMQHMKALEGKVIALESASEQQKQVERTEASERLMKEISDFAADPKHIYFENVAPRMEALLRTKQATDLATAYDMATWADPNIRKLIMAAESNQRAAEDAKRVSQARRLGVSVTGDPGAGRGAHSAPAPTESSNPRDDIAGDVRRALREVRANA